VALDNSGCVIVGLDQISHPSRAMKKKEIDVIRYAHCVQIMLLLYKCCTFNSHA
jgi:hypothetical protein